MQIHDNFESTKRGTIPTKVVQLNSRIHQSFLQKQRAAFMHRQREKLKRTQLIRKTDHPRIGYHQYVDHNENTEYHDNSIGKDEKERKKSTKIRDCISEVSSKNYNQNFEPEKSESNKDARPYGGSQENEIEERDKYSQRSMKTKFHIHDNTKNNGISDVKECGQNQHFLDNSSATRSLKKKDRSTVDERHLSSQTGDKIGHRSLSPEKEGQYEKNQRVRLTKSMSCLSEMMNTPRVDLESKDDGKSDRRRNGNMDERYSKLSSEIDSKFSMKDLDIDSPEKMRKFLMSPLPKKAGVLECYIKRNRRKNKLYPEYR